MPHHNPPEVSPAPGSPCVPPVTLLLLLSWISPSLSRDLVFQSEDLFTKKLHRQNLTAENTFQHQRLQINIIFISRLYLNKPDSKVAGHFCVKQWV